MADLTEEELLGKVSRLKELTDGLCADAPTTPTMMKESIEELRELARIAKELEGEILRRVLSHG